MANDNTIPIPMFPEGYDKKTWGLIILESKYYVESGDDEGKPYPLYYIHYIYIKDKENTKIKLISHFSNSNSKYIADADEQNLYYQQGDRQGEYGEPHESLHWVNISETRGPYRDDVFRRIGLTDGGIFNNTYQITSVAYSDVYVYDYDNPDTIVINNDITDYNPFDFEPDEGEAPDDGGGNQNWGQGNPSISTGGGTYDDSSDAIAQGVSTSFKAGQSYNNYFVLTLPQIFEVKEKVWGLTVPGLTKPSEGIISLLSFPFDLTSRSFDSTSKNVLIGNSFMELTDNLWMLEGNYNNMVDFGSIKIEPYFAGFQDYSPYTKIQIYLPFIGIRDLDPLYVQNKTLSVKYYINFSSGSCIAALFSDNVLYTRFNGQVGQTIPLSQVNNSLVEATLGTAFQTAAGVVSGGITAGLAIGTASSALSTIASSRPSISGSAGIGGENELSMPLQCFLIIERPDCAVSQTYNAEKGRPSLINKKLAKCKGFTTMLDPHVMAPCTDEENAMINNLLKEGVVIK